LDLSMCGCYTLHWQLSWLICLVHFPVARLALVNLAGFREL
jgi:hypothetical protein